ncbi:MAG: hypothetical protein LBH05_01480 [Deferribacteraceae bacterium]|jgi:hypothetical protein|nr:hypothetical protein [Deferribacteraceae bacterium]
MKKLTLLLFVCALFVTAAFAAPVTVDAVGEAQIVRGDVPSAKIQAESRARWAAMESAAQVKVKSETVIHNAELLDEFVKSEVKGSITNFKITNEGKDGDIYWVQAKVTVEPSKAQNVMGGLAMNTKVVVYLPMIKLDGSVTETHAFSEQVVQDLINNKFEVIDMASDDPKLSETLSKAVQKNDMATVRALVSKYMASYALVGTVKVVDKGKDSGYGDIPFIIVDGEVAYRLVGGKSILASGTMTNRGQGATAEQAANTMSKNLAKKESGQLVSVVSQKVLGDNKRTVRITLAGNRDVKNLQEFRDMIKNVAWVLDVKELGVDALSISYPEKTLYLAAIIGTKGYTVKNFTDTEVVVNLR